MLTALLLLILMLAAPSWAEEPRMNLGAHFKDHTTFEEVVDLRCTRCHDRERIGEAMREQADVVIIQRRMIEFGAVLTPRDKSVLGTFWGSPLREKGEAPLPEPEGFDKE